MRIKRLQLAGFKSCMERTTLDFPIGITGIVGPNGCGKSNIVDALRWVLGEQSAKHLRGEIMEDVIFAGNERYSPLGAAEVSITLDNEGPMPTIVADAEDGEPSPLVAILQESAEIEVTRRLFRSGESEYLINGRPCRLRDITELFLGTGVGTKAYSIIEQGRVGQIVNAKPEELRLFIEEAAGTTLYRSRKLAAERKIERTRNNLLRVSDIVAELDRQASSLRRQVRGAVRYRELKTEEEQLDRSLTRLRLDAIRVRVDDLAARLEELRRNESDAREAARALTETRDSSREEEARLLERADEARKAFYESRGRLTAAVQERQFLEQRTRDLAGATEAERKEILALSEKRANVTREVRAAIDEAASIAQETATAAVARQTIEQELAEAERSLAEIEQQMEAARDVSVAALADQARLDNEVATLIRDRDLIRDRVSRVQEEGASLGTVTEQLMRHIDEGKRRLDELDLQIGSTAGSKETAAKRVLDLSSRRSEAERFADKRRADVASLGSRYESLRELNDSFAGYTEGVRFIMSRGADRPVGGEAAVVAELLEIDAGFEKAVAAVLADRLQCIVVEDAAEGVRGAEFLRATDSGRASFLPKQARRAMRSNGRGTLPSGATWLGDHVRVRDGYQSAAETLFADVAVANDLRSAAAAWERAPGQASFVTREGDLIDASGVVTGGSGKPGDEALLARKAELRGIRIKLVDAEVKEREARAAFDALLQEANQASVQLSELDRRSHELTVARVAAAGDLELQKQNLARTEERQRSVRTEISSLAAEEASVAERLEALREELNRLRQDRDAAEQAAQSCSARRLAVQQTRDEVSGKLAAARVREAELVQLGNACTLRRRSLEDSTTDLSTRAVAAEQRLERDAAELEAARRRLSEPTLTVDALRNDVEASEHTLRDLETAVGKSRADLGVLDRRLDEASQTIDGLREERGRLEVALRECDLERTSVVDGLRERLDIEPEALFAREEGEAPPQPEDAVEVADELERVRAGIRRLGVVNVAAVTELEEIDKRLEELSSQKADLERSMEDLRGTIARLNRMSRQRFKDTFDRVDEIFRQTFPRLFQGGKAWLTLTDEANLLETGVEIFVQPPGKKLGNINLMSGGEKALTAVSLIFSLFLHKPSPFCVLDEVDAPLDDANIGRFARMVLEMSGRSQFLLITHNKKTMESCNTLYGVTMREPGVSKIVSVEMPN